MLRSSRHDYQYYPSRWYDESTGTQYEAGYYDENGQYYKNVAVKKGSSYETLLECEYCGTQIKLKWEEGAIPSCPNCGAQLTSVADNAVVEDALQDQIVSSGNYRRSSGSGCVKPIIIALSCFFFLPTLFYACMTRIMNIVMDMTMSMKMIMVILRKKKRKNIIIAVVENIIIK